MDYSQYNLEKTGYLKEDFRLFHINDQTKKDFSYHYHDFHKIIVFISGKVTYHIEGKAYHLKPRDILLVSQGAIHKPEIDPSVSYERYIFWIRDDLSCQELNTCFQKANDRSFNLVRADSALLSVGMRADRYRLRKALIPLRMRAFFFDQMQSAKYLID